MSFWNTLFGTERRRRRRISRNLLAVTRLAKRKGTTAWGLDFDDDSVIEELLLLGLILLDGEYVDDTTFVEDTLPETVELVDTATELTETVPAELEAVAVEEVSELTAESTVTEDTAIRTVELKTPEVEPVAVLPEVVPETSISSGLSSGLSRSSNWASETSSSDSSWSGSSDSGSSFDSGGGRDD